MIMGSKIMYMAGMRRSTEAMLMSALAREESRGAHFRSDFPETKEEFRRCSFAEYKDGEISIGFEGQSLTGENR